MASKAVQKIVKEMSREELEYFILNLAEEDKKIGQRLRLQSAGPDELKAAKSLIRASMRQAADQIGFIPAYKSGKALTGAGEVLAQVDRHLEKGEGLHAARLAVLVIGEVVDSLQFMDDSTGQAGEILFYSMDTVLEVAKKTDGEEAEKLFHELLKEAEHPRYQGWSDPLYTFWEAAAVLTRRKPQLRPVLEDYLHRARLTLAENRTQDFNVKKLLETESLLIELHDGKETALAFKMKYLEDNADFLYEVVEEMIEQKEWKKAMELVENSTKKTSYPGVIHQLEKYKARIYRGLGETEKEKKLLIELLKEDRMFYDETFHTRLKELYDPESWPKAREALLDEVRMCGAVYLTICEEEQLLDRLLACCFEQRHLIETYYPLLQKSYPEKAKQAYKEFIMDIAVNATNRKKYKKIGYKLKDFAEAGGREESLELIRILKEQYPKRTAMLDELDKAAEKI